MIKATKDELRLEIADLRHVGRQMANLCFNLGQNYDIPRDSPRILRPADAKIMYDLSKQWDAIKRAEER